MVREENQFALQRRARSKSPTPHQTGIVASGKAVRVVEILNEDHTECISIGAAHNTKTTEVREILAGFCRLDPNSLELVSHVGSYARAQSIYDDVASKVTAKGIKSFTRPTRKYEHPILILGAGLGGIQTMVRLQQNGRQDFVCLERLHDFGGWSWMGVANRFTKLQTEKGTYHVNYIIPGAEVPKSFGSLRYKTWPSRDQLLRMFRESAREHGLYDKTHFGVEVEKVKVLPGFAKYAVATTPANNPDEAGEVVMASGVMAWPGNLCYCREIEWPGEDDFGGYIEYSSFGKVDYTQAEGKTVILYGHGAFTIENVRTLVEFRCKKVFVMCRQRNLCGMKVVSWMVGGCEVPIPGHIMLEAFQKMYDLVGFDVWSAHSVKTDANRTFAHISQKTVFGVTDVYFLAGYYDLMEVVVDEIKRVTPFCAHTKKGKKLQCEVILKAVGTVSSFKTDKLLGLKELHGLWVQNDPLRPVVCNAMYVEARNFGSFSSGPGFASMVVALCWFIDYPDDYEAITGKMPINKRGERPAYVPAATHLTPTMTLLGSQLPMLGMAMNAVDVLKARKQMSTHPPGQYVAECRAEWESYVRMFKKEGMVDNRPEPSYPYTEAMCQDWVDRSNMYWMSRQAA
mmetsp:Transcript_25192/g.63972  ORF Transcript_25192/g.63972 Transcript_25192/m.63972 type:complete len:626 (-) Transcript_25192:73-1950(-)